LAGCSSPVEGDEGNDHTGRDDLRRITNCTHRSCSEGNCRKCEYNPNSGYSPYHYRIVPNTPAHRAARKRLFIWLAALLIATVMLQSGFLSWVMSFIIPKD